MNEELSLEEKVKVLEEKVDKLEKIEKRRKTLKWIKIGIKLLLIIVIIIFVYRGYVYLKKNYLDPYDNFRNGLQEKKDSIINYDYGSLFDGLFK